MTDLALGIVPTIGLMPGGSISMGSAALTTDGNDATFLEIGGGITEGLQYQRFAFDLGAPAAVDHVEVRCSDVFLDNDQFSVEGWRWWRVRTSDNGSAWTDLATGLLTIPLAGWDNGQSGPAAHQGGTTGPLPVATHRYWEYSFGKNHGLQGYGALRINTLSLMAAAPAAPGDSQIVVV